MCNGPNPQMLQYAAWQRQAAQTPATVVSAVWNVDESDSTHGVDSRWGEL